MTPSAEQGSTGERYPGGASVLLGCVALGATYGVTQSWFAAIAAGVASTAAVHATVKAKSRRS